MADDISLYLLWFADLSVIITILSVMIGFGISVVLILRLNGENLFARVNTAPNVAPKIRMQTWVNPYFIKLHKPELMGHLKDGVHIEVSSLESGCLQAYWGTEVAATYEAMQNPEEAFYHQLSEGTLLRENCHHLDQPIVLDGPGHHLLHLPAPAHLEPTMLGTVPRQRYPCLLLLYSLPRDREAGQDEVIANFTIIHIKDEVCRIETHIIGQFLKTWCNRIYNMQPLFMSTCEDGLADANSTPSFPPPVSIEPSNDTSVTQSGQGSDDDDNNNDATECVVCQSAPLTHVILPCRHACSCASCFKQLDRCPLCRGTIETYFLLTSEDCEVDRSASAANLPWFENSVERLNTWVNERFGL